MHTSHIRFPCRWRASAPWLLLALLAGCLRSSEDSRPGPFLVPCAVAQSDSAWAPAPMDTEAPSPAIAVGDLENRELLGAAVDGTLVTSGDGGRTWERMLPEGICHLPVATVGNGSRRDGTLCVQARKVRGRPQDAYCSVDGGQTWRWLSLPEERQKILLVSEFPLTVRHRVNGPARVFRIMRDILRDGGLPQARQGEPGPLYSIAHTDDLGGIWRADLSALNPYIELQPAHEGVLMSLALPPQATLWCDLELNCDEVLPHQSTVVAVNPWRPRERVLYDSFRPDLVYCGIDGTRQVLDADLADHYPRLRFLDIREPHGSLVAYDDHADAKMASVHLSTDGGRAWQMRGQLPEAGCDAPKEIASVLFAVCGSHLFRSADAGLTWDLVELPGGGVF